jgi:hypothetical protein
VRPVQLVMGITVYRTPLVQADLWYLRDPGHGLLWRGAGGPLYGFATRADAFAHGARIHYGYPVLGAELLVAALDALLAVAP